MGSDPSRVVRGLVASYAEDHPWLMAFGVASTFVTPIQDILLPHLTGGVVGAIKEAGENVGDAAKSSAVLWAFVAVGAAIAVVQLAYFGVDLVDAKMFPSLMTHVRRRMLRCIMDSNDTAQEGELETGDLLTKFVKVPMTVGNWFESAKAIVPNVLVYIFAAVYFWAIDPMLGATLLVGVAATFASLVVNLRSCGDLSESRDVALNRLHERIDEVLHNLPAIFAAGQKRAEQEALAPLEDASESLYYRTVVCATAVKTWMVPIALLMVFVMLWRSLALLRSDRMAVAQFVAIFGVILYLMTSMMRIVQNSRSMVYYWGIIKSSIDTLEGCGRGDRGDNRRARGEVVDEPPGTVVTLQSVSYVHAGATRRALDSVSLSISEGDRVAIVGAMGSGKTTLVRLILRLIEPTSGRLLLRGRPYADMTAEQVRSEFGYVPQGAALFDRTVLENAFYGIKGAPEDHADRTEAAWDAARLLGVDVVLSSLQQGLDTMAGKGGSKLSGGQRQAVWLIRMQLLSPSVLVLDEPTSAMDPGSRESVAAAVSRFRTVVFVTHDISFVDAVATRTVTIDSGRIASDAAAAGKPPVHPEDCVDWRRRIVEEGLVGSTRFHDAVYSTSN